MRGLYIALIPNGDPPPVTVSQATTASDAYARARFNMVESQIRTNRVGDERLLAALSDLPREIFVPAALAGVAYADKSLPIGGGRFLSEPLFLARLLQEASPTGTAKALVVGAGTGYSAALLSRLCASVVALECDSGLATAARANLARLGCAEVKVEIGPLAAGWPAGAPYGLILIDGVVCGLPDVFAGQMAEGGCLVTIESRDGRCGSGMLYRKIGGALSGRVLFDAVGPFLPGFEPQPAFAL